MRANKRSRECLASGSDSDSGSDSSFSSSSAASRPSASPSNSPTLSPDPSAVLHDFISSSFQSKLIGDSRNYYLLCSQLSESLNGRDESACQRWFTALAQHSGFVSAENSPALMELILAVDYSLLPSSLVCSFHSLLYSLFTAHNRPYPIYRLLIKHFTLDSATHSVHQQEIHSLIRRISIISPQSVPLIASLLMDHFPHRRVSPAVLTAYIHNFLHVLRYLPSLRDRLLSFLLEQILSIDVEVSVSCSHSAWRLGQSGQENAKFLQGEMADKLDAILVLVMEYLNNVSSSSSGASQSLTSLTSDFSSGDSFAVLLRVFEKSILRTHQSRFTQFLLFYYCSFKHVYAEAFLRWLLEKAFDRESSQLDRQNAALFIASFTGRAAFLRHASTIVAFEMLLQWCLQYVAYHEAIPNFAPVGPLESPRHAHFYRCFQSCIYILLYRQHSFASMIEADEELIEKFHFADLVNSKLNPLRYCLAPLVQEFARVAQALNIVDCQEIIEKNKRFHEQSNTAAAHSHSRSHSHSNGEFASFDPSDTYFPFDPFFLKRSHKFIEPLYSLYQPITFQSRNPEADLQHASTSPISISIPAAAASTAADTELQRLSSSLSDITVSPPSFAIARAASSDGDSASLLPPPLRADSGHAKKGKTIFSSSREQGGRERTAGIFQQAADRAEEAGNESSDHEPSDGMHQREQKKGQGEEDGADSASDSDSDSDSDAHEAAVGSAYLTGFAPTYSPTFSPSLPPLNPMAGISFNSNQFQNMFQ